MLLCSFVANSSLFGQVTYIMFMTADALVSTGLARLGYVYVNIGIY